MKIKAITGALAIVWGATMLIVGLLNLAFPVYGAEFLRTMSSVYPGFHDSRTIWQVLFGTAYGFVDGAIGGFFLGLLYRWFAGKREEAVSTAAPTAVSGATLRRAS
jgi:hypothetical protein